MKIDDLGITLGGFLIHGGTPKSSSIVGIFHEINHPDTIQLLGIPHSWNLQMRVIKKCDFVLFRADLGSQKVSRVMNYRVLQKKTPSCHTHCEETLHAPFPPIQCCYIALLGKANSKKQKPHTSMWGKRKHFQWIGLRENLQESPIFNGKIYGFL